jgi:chromatin remodeling complex protein RSC6
VLECLIQVHKLQDSENKETINTDENLKNAFKCEKIPFSSINGRIRELLSPVEPIIINMSISGDRPQ